ncbi:hypothetical protein PPERSA_04799 [Pseudocohnilembus persalinus]|uniref:Uncharacterized protein n=1 Tax=Pseudocohnilembus persalinus TaxID=266149 RepID=A0A0V0QLJ6_PSEPJ|nr:hypothetical protein PPERSA_04799 [Pseudocohnilembus persalinus]|eukprot:KRX03004.1 hypothetical protein PPERSA_04799 [Pseudocohnilembus persalinus]
MKNMNDNTWEPYENLVFDDDDELQQIKNLNNHDDSTTDPENCSIELLEYVNLKELQTQENQKYQQKQQGEEGEEQKKQLNGEKYINEESQYLNQNSEPNKQICNKKIYKMDTLIILFL